MADKYAEKRADVPAFATKKGTPNARERRRYRASLALGRKAGAE